MSTFELAEQDALTSAALAAAERQARWPGALRHRRRAPTELGSQQDANFRIASDAGTFVLKVSNPAFAAEDLDAQDQAAAHVAEHTGIAVPVPVPGTDGRTIQPVQLGDQSTVARLVTYVDGDVLSASPVPGTADRGRAR